MPKIQGTNRTVQTNTARLTPPNHKGFGASGRATQQLGKAVAQAGNAIASSFGAIQEKRDDANDRMTILETSIAADKALMDHDRNYTGSGKGFRDEAEGINENVWNGSYSKLSPKGQQKAREFQLRKKQSVLRNADRRQDQHSQAYVTQRLPKFYGSVLEGSVTKDALTEHGLQPAHAAISIGKKYIDDAGLPPNVKTKLYGDLITATVGDVVQKIDPGQYKKDAAAHDASIKTSKSIVGYSRGNLGEFKVANRSDGKKVDVSHLKPEFRNKLSQLQQGIGKQLTINSGYRDPKHNAKVGGAKNSRHIHRDAVDLQWPKNATIQEKQQIIAHARKLGFKGFGIGNGILHLDTGNSRFWGYKNGKPSSNIPGWAVDALSGKVKVAKNSAGGVQGQIANAAKKAGLDPEYMIRLASSESSFRPGVKADTSSATGLFQITGDTAKRLGTSHGKKSVDQEISDGIAITKANQKTMTNYLGRAPRNDELHLAHVFGAGRANGIISSKNETPVHKVLPPEVIKANADGIFKKVKTVGQLKAWAKAKQSVKVDVASYQRSTGDVFTDELFSKKNREIVDKRYQKSLDQQLISGLVRGEIELNPYDKESNQKLDKALVNAETANRILNGDDELLQGMSLFAIKQRKAPKPFVEGLMGLARSDDPKNKIKAYTAVDQIYTQSPHAFEQSANGKKLLKEAETYRFLVQDRGFSSEKAIERIELMKDPEFQKGRELREKEAKLEAGKLTSEGLLDDLDIEGWFGSNYDINSFPNAELLLMDQYKKVFVDAFAENGGDTEMAKKTAQKVIAKDYGLSSVTGRTEFMRNPPEKIYPSIGKSHEYISRQLSKDITDYLGVKPGDFNLNNVMIRADRRTTKEINSGRLPSYNIIYRDEDGVLQQMPGRWAPDMKEAETDRDIRQESNRRLEKEQNSSPYHPHNLVRWARGLEPIELPPGFLKRYDDDDIENKVQEIKEEKARNTAVP